MAPAPGFDKERRMKCGVTKSRAAEQNAAARQPSQRIPDRSDANAGIVFFSTRSVKPQSSKRQIHFAFAAMRRKAAEPHEKNVWQAFKKKWLRHLDSTRNDA